MLHHQHQHQQQHSQNATAARSMQAPSFASPSTNLAYLSSPSQPLMSFSPPTLSSNLPLALPLPSPSFTASAFSPAYSPHLFASSAAASTAPGSGGSAGGGSGGSGVADSKSLSRYRVLEGGGGGGGGVSNGGAARVSDEHLKILATLSQLSQSNGFSSHAQQQPGSAFNPLPLQPPPAYSMQQQQQQYHSARSPTTQQTTPPQGFTPVMSSPLTASHISPPFLQQPVPVQPHASHSSLLNITPPMSAVSLLSKPSSTPPPTGHSPHQQQQQQQQQTAGGLDVSSFSSPVLLHHLQLVFQQHLAQQAQSIQLTGSPSSPSALSSLQQLQSLQQLGSAVLSNLRAEQLQAVVGLVQQRGAAVLPAVLLQMGQEDRQHLLQQQAGDSQMSGMFASPQPTGVYIGRQSLPPQANFYLSSPQLLHAASSAGSDLLGLANEVDADGIRRRNASGRLLAGSSCHQCKTRRISAELIYCAQSHVKKGRQRKRQMLAAAAMGVPTAAGGKQERLCRKKYCQR